MSRLFVLVVVALVWAQQGAAINPDALKPLVNPKLIPFGSIVGERCAMYEDALRNGPWGGDFANLNRSELMKSILEFDGNALRSRLGGPIVFNIRDCLLPNPTFDDKATKWRSGPLRKQDQEFNRMALKRLLAPKLRSWYNTAQERCAAYEEVLRNGPWGQDLSQLDSYKLMEAILDNKKKSYPLTGLDAAPIREDVRRCLYPDKTPEPKPYNASNDQAPKDRPRRRVAIKPDALKRLLDLKLSGSTVGERCIAYEESLRNEPDGEEFANLTRYELLRSIISDLSDRNPLTENYKIIPDVEECLFTSDTYEARLKDIEKYYHEDDLPLDRRCDMAKWALNAAMRDHPLQKASKAEKFKQAILDLEELSRFPNHVHFLRLLKECVNKFPEYQA